MCEGKAKRRASKGVNTARQRITQKGLVYFCSDSCLVVEREEASFCLDFLLTFSSWKK